MDRHVVFYLCLAQIVKHWLPFSKLRQVVRHTATQKNVPVIAAIHDSLRRINSTTGNVELFINIPDQLYKTAVNTHSQLNIWLVPECAADLNSTFNRRERTVEKYQGHSVTRVQADQIFLGFGSTQLGRSPYNLF
jgi:hypothetical protein